MNNAHQACIINAADASHAYSFQWATFGTHRRNPDAPGLLVATNHFVDPPKDWKVRPLSPKPEERAFSSERRSNLLKLADSEKFKGKLSAQSMMQMLEVTLDKGGATFPDATLYQIVAVPADRLLWLRVPGQAGWEKIDLKALFQINSPRHTRLLLRILNLLKSKFLSIRARVKRALPCRKHPLPPGFPHSLGVFPGQGLGDVDLSEPFLKILMMEGLHHIDLRLQLVLQVPGQDGGPVLAALATPDKNEALA